MPFQLLTFISHPDPGPHSREYVHDPAEPNSFGATLSISLCVSVSPEMGIREQAAEDPCHYADFDAERTRRRGGTR